MKRVLILLPAAFSMLLSCTSKPETTTTTETGVAANNTDKELLDQAKVFFQPLPAVAENAANPLTDEKIKLGKTLYFDTRLSLKGNNSCNSCHSLDKYGVDNLPVSKGDNGGFGERNSPTVLNAALHSFQFWDGRAKDVEEQAGGPILNPVEMAIPTKEFLVKRLKGVPEYQPMFKAAFPEAKTALTYENVQNAIGAFERTLITPSAFDKFLNGEVTAMTTEQKEGLHAFINTGCITCHTGPSLGGTMFQKFGLTADYRTFTHSKVNDEGKKKLTNQEADKDLFKVPGLRNISKTYPYFHDGSIADLGEAVKIMAKAELGKDLTDQEVKAIVSFLDALTGEVPAGARLTARLAP